MQNKPLIIFGQLPQNMSQRISHTYGSVTAGVSDVILGPAQLERPELNDLTGKEALEQYKEYNVNTNLRINQKRLWAEVAEKVTGSLLTGATIALGTILFGAGALAEVTFASVAPGLMALGGLVAASVGVYYAFKAPAIREQSEKYMDVDDYKIHRQAGILAQEIKKALQEDKAPAHGADLLVVAEPANQNEVPSSVLSANAHERVLEPRLQEAKASHLSQA